MPDGVTPDEGLGRGLRWLVNNEDTLIQNWEAFLFVNDLTPDADTVWADVVEPSWTGYARATIDPTFWSDPFIDDNEASVQYGDAPLQFENGGGATETVYGWGFYDPLFGVVRLIQRFDSGDISAVAPGESKYILPKMTRRSAA